LFPKGKWENGACRPKNPNFKVLKTPFKETDKLVFNRIYIIETIIKQSGFGFYPDGRLIFVSSKDGFALKEEDVTDKTWNTNVTIGYWRVNENKIKVEYFICKDGGYYLENKGEIKGDTIIFYQNIHDFLFKKREVRSTFYVLSDMEFR
jgi:hypothetical protein